jgi:hypothetical protein
MHKYSASNAMTASPVPFTTHQAIEEGQPPYMMQKKRCIMERVAEKSKHVRALSTKNIMYTATAREVSKKEAITHQPVTVEAVRVA